MTPDEVRPDTDADDRAPGEERSPRTPRPYRLEHQPRAHDPCEQDPFGPRESREGEQRRGSDRIAGASATLLHDREQRRRDKQGEPHGLQTARDP
jgi:hypothetical protein